MLTVSVEWYENIQDCIPMAASLELFQNWATETIQHEATAAPVEKIGIDIALSSDWCQEQNKQWLGLLSG